MIQPAFDIGQTEQVPADGELLIDISAQSLNFILYRKEPYELLLLRQYRLYTTAQKTTSDLIAEVIDSDRFIQGHTGAARIVYNFSEATLVPDEFYDDALNTSLTRVISGDASSVTVCGERIAGLGMHNVYRVPSDIHSLLGDKFVGSAYSHIYSLMLTAPHKYTGKKANALSAVFYHDKFITSLHLEGALQLVQTFRYQTPEDVAYYMLLICRQSGLEPADVDVYVSGLIDSQSALYAELLKYFPDVHEEGLPDGVQVNELLNDYPAHYFSPLLKMSLCVL